MRRFLIAAALLSGMAAARPPGIVQIDDRPHDAVATLATTPAADGFVAPDRATRGTAHLRAHVDKASGLTRFELVQQLRYLGPQRDYALVHYHDGDAVARTGLNTIRHRAPSCPGSAHAVDCVRTVDLAFELDEPTIRAIARHKTGWRFRIKDAGEKDVTATIAPGDAAALLLATDTYRRNG